MTNEFSVKWELLVSGIEDVETLADSQIHIVKESEISKNVKGEWLAPISEGDTVSPTALGEILRTINNQQDLDFIYTDHDLIDSNDKRTDPFFKPE